MAESLVHLGVEALAGRHLPSRLREDPDPPGVLFVAGCTPGAAGRAHGSARDGAHDGVPDGAPHVPTVAVVGTRKASEYGLAVARRLGRELAEAGIRVVSGLALGIDAAAHAGALSVGEGQRSHVAVIGAGHHRPCPARNRPLAATIAATGLLLSEVPPGVTSAPWRYPVRNRLIAALVDVVVVVESPSSGGSMSTVAEALLRDRVVMAVPGAVGRRSAAGCHDLLRDGAQICTGAGDVVEMLGLLGFTCGPTSAAPGAGPGVDVDADVEVVVEALCDGPLTIDSLARRCSLELPALSALVAGMQTRGIVVCDAGWVRQR